MNNLSENINFVSENFRSILGKKEITLIQLIIFASKQITSKTQTSHSKKKMNKILLIFLLVSIFDNRIVSGKILRIKRDTQIFSLRYWKDLIGLKSTTLAPCLEYAEDDNSCLGEPISLDDDTYQYKSILTGFTACPSGSKFDKRKVCRKVLRK
ncbi:hypothetical protein ACKWTF_006124 [Chironomus riparius]